MDIKERIDELTKMLEKSSHIAPLLVKLYENKTLYETVKGDNPEARRELVGAVVGILDAELAPHEQEIFSDVMVGLLQQAEKDLRQAVSERLAVLDSAPLRVVLHLANDEIEVAAPVLRESPVLTDMDLIYIIKSKGSAHWQAVAKREGISPDVVEALAETHDVDTAIILTENQRVSLTQRAVEILAGMAAENAALAKPLSQRHEVPEGLAKALYVQAARAVSYRPEVIADRRAKAALDQVTEEIVGDSMAPTDDIRTAARLAAQKGLLTPAYLMKPLQRGQMATFVALFAQYTGQSEAVISQVIKQPCGKGLAVLCRTSGVGKRDFAMMYQLTQRARKGLCDGQYPDVGAAVNYYVNLSDAMALRLSDKVTEF